MNKMIENRRSTPDSDDSDIDDPNASGVEDYDMDGEDDGESEEEEEKDIVMRKGKGKQVSEKENKTPKPKKAPLQPGNKRKLRSVSSDEEEEDIIPPKKKVKIVLDTASPSPIQKSTSQSKGQRSPKKKQKKQPVTSHNIVTKPSPSSSRPRVAESNMLTPVIWSTCPKLKCREKLPLGTPSATIARLFANRWKILARHEPKIEELESCDAKICKQITWENKYKRLRDLGRARGWPVQLDFSQIVTQTLAMQDELIGLVKDPAALFHSIIWDDFLSSIDSKIHEFGESDTCFEDVAFQARCGYLGPQGAQLILSSIWNIFSRSSDVLTTSLTKTICSLVSDYPKHFDDDSRIDKSVPIVPLDAVIQYVLVPYAVTWVIAADLDVSFMEALDVKNASCDFGDMFNWDVKHPKLIALEEMNERTPSPTLSPRLIRVSSPIPPPTHCTDRKPTSSHASAAAKSSSSRKTDQKPPPVEFSPAPSEIGLEFSVDPPRLKRKSLIAGLDGKRHRVRRKSLLYLIIPQRGKGKPKSKSKDEFVKPAPPKKAATKNSKPMHSGVSWDATPPARCFDAGCGAPPADGEMCAGGKSEDRGRMYNGASTFASWTAKGAFALNVEAMEQLEEAWNVKKLRHGVQCKRPRADM
ncbi:hypothetical protein DFH09DRAFT_1339735 [Mycena vulgaris]|nr:hypothetical protein DFH09DRAFT_1339735 [Mycena vulgaris]